MLTFQNIPSIATPEFALAWQLYEEAFPSEERRSLVQQEALLLQAGPYSFKAAFQEKGLIGILGVWAFPEFSFLEHFAVDKSRRGQGLGQAIMSLLQQDAMYPIILEVEVPTTVLAQRRIAFYQRLGFHLNPFAYQQPPYSKVKPWVPLQLMSFPQPLNKDLFLQTVKVLYTKVYQVSFP